MLEKSNEAEDIMTDEALASRNYRGVSTRWEDHYHVSTIVRRISSKWSEAYP